MMKTNKIKSQSYSLNEAFKALDELEPIKEEFDMSSYNAICDELANACNKKFPDAHITSDDIIFDDSRAWSLYVYGNKLGLPVYKFGAFRNYHGGGMRDAIQHNGREQEGTKELGELFAKKLSEIEDLINADYQDEEEWDKPTGVLLKNESKQLKERKDTQAEFDANFNDSIEQRIKDTADNLRDTCKNDSAKDLYTIARQEHTWALGSQNKEEATMHEINADAYRLLAKEKEGTNESKEDKKVCPKCGKEPCECRKNLKAKEMSAKDIDDAQIRGEMTESKLTEKHWNYRLKNGKELRKQINAENYEGIRKSLLDCYKELLDNKLIEKDDYDQWTEEVRDSEFGDEDEVDYQLGEFYDLCDNIGAWVELDEELDEETKIQPKTVKERMEDAGKVCPKCHKEPCECKKDECKEIKEGVDKDDYSNEKKLQIPPYSIMYWQTQNDRNLGYGESYADFDENDLDDALNCANLIFFDTLNAAAVEVKNSKGELVYGLYATRGRKSRKSIGESKDKKKVCPKCKKNPCVCKKCKKNECKK